MGIEESSMGTEYNIFENSLPGCETTYIVKVVHEYRSGADLYL